MIQIEKASSFMEAISLLEKVDKLSSPLNNVIIELPTCALFEYNRLHFVIAFWKPSQLYNRLLH